MAENLERKKGQQNLPNYISHNLHTKVEKEKEREREKEKGEIKGDGKSSSDSTSANSGPKQQRQQQRPKQGAQGLGTKVQQVQRINKMHMEHNQQIINNFL